MYCGRRNSKRHWACALLGIPFFAAMTLWAGNPLLPAPAFAAPTRVVSLKHFSTQGYTRIVLVLNRRSLSFRTGKLKNPARIYVDIPAGRLKPGFRLPTFQKSSLAQKIRVGRPNRKTMRLLIHLLHSGVRHHAFTLSKPNRIVIDLRETLTTKKTPVEQDKPTPRQKSPRKKSEARARPAPRLETRKYFSEDRSKGRARARKPLASDAKRRSMSLTDRFRAGVGRVVLDPGHGGRDPGATGLYGTKEKTLVLDISKRVASALRKKLPPGNLVLLTRDRDRFIELEDRTSFANRNDSDVFVSIHLNSSPIKSTSGVETYLLAEASTPRALELAARESGTTVSRLTDLQKILNDLMLRSKVSESYQLATQIQNSTMGSLKRRYSGTKSLGVKRGPFYVLVGATMPSILIELAFLTNPREAKRLLSPKYRQALSEGIARGIVKFVGAPYKRTYLSDGEGTSRLAGAGPAPATRR